MKQADVVYLRMTRLTSLFTAGATTDTVGNAIRNDNPQALNQICRKLPTSPTFSRLTTSDMMHDMSNAMKNAKTTGRYFCLIKMTFQDLT
jgi:hypothetical protein